MRDFTAPADFRQEIKEIQETDVNNQKSIDYQKQRLAERFIEKINPNTEPNYDLAVEKANAIYTLLCNLYEMQFDYINRQFGGLVARKEGENMIDSYVKNIQNAQSVLEIEEIVAQAIVDGEYDSKIADEAEHILNLNK